MKIKVLIGLIGFSLTGLYSCYQPTTGSYGYIYTSVNFPQSGFRIKNIPDNTTSIAVEVIGEGMSEPIKFTLMKTNPSRLINNVPIGSKLVKASANDASGKALARGEGLVIIKANIKNTIEITLTEIPVVRPSSNGPGNNSSPTIPPQVSESPVLPSGNPPESPDVNVSDNPVSPSPSSEPTPTPSVTPSPTASPVSGRDRGGSSGQTGGGNTDISNTVGVDIITQDGSPIPPGIVGNTPVPTTTPTPTASPG